MRALQAITYTCIALGCALALPLALPIVATFAGAALLLGVALAGWVRYTEVRLAARNDALRLLLWAEDREHTRRAALLQAGRILTDIEYREVR